MLAAPRGRRGSLHLGCVCWTLLTLLLTPWRPRSVLPDEFNTPDSAPRGAGVSAGAEGREGSSLLDALLELAEEVEAKRAGMTADEVEADVRDAQAEIDRALRNMHRERHDPDTQTTHTRAAPPPGKPSRGPTTGSAATTPEPRRMPRPPR